MKTVLLVVGALCLLGAALSLGDLHTMATAAAAALLCGIGYAVLDRLDRIHAALTAKPPAPTPTHPEAVAPEPAPAVAMTDDPELEAKLRAMRDLLPKR